MRFLEKNMTIKELSKFWNIPNSTLRSRKTKSKKEFEAFVLGSFCIKNDITMLTLSRLLKVKKHGITKPASTATNKKEI